MIKKIHVPLISTAFLVFSLGFVTLFSTSPERARLQIIFLFVGVAFYIGVSNFDYHILKFVWKPLYVFGLILLFVTYLTGEVRFGSARWINLGVFSFQPSEVAKLILIITLASFLSIYHKSINNLKTIILLTGLVLPLLVLVFIQPDLGTSIVLVLVVLGMLLYTNFNKIYFLILLSLFGILSAPVWNLLADYQKERILVFLNPQLDVLGAGYNVIQSLIAIGSGGIFGRGFSQGTQSHLHFLPAYWTDFAFASFAEEWGFIGVVVFFGLYTAFLFIILRVAFIVKDSFGSVLCFGVFLVFLVQFIINVGMNLGLMPVTGIPLPLVSYGGSSLLISCILLGLVQNVWTKSS